MNMTLLYSRWPKFKQEFISIACLSIIQLWFAFNYPLSKIAAPWNTIAAVTVAFGLIILIAYLFSFADSYAQYYSFEKLNKLPYGARWKKIERIMPLIMMHIWMFLIWYHDFWTTQYALQYAMFLLMTILFYRAMHRKPE